MPVYLVHGFRWPRQAVRIHVILENLDDVAADWLLAPNSAAALLENFHEKFPVVMENLPDLRLIEEYIPSQTTSFTPFAYVADTVYEIQTSVNIDDVRGKGMSNEKWTAISELRDALCKDEKLAWYVVICEDLTREVPPEPDDEENEGMIGRPSVVSGISDEAAAPVRNGTTNGDMKKERRGSISRGLKKIFGRKDLKKSASLKDLKNPRAMSSSNTTIGTSHVTTTPSPPPPPIPLQYQEEMARMRNNKSTNNLPQRPVTQGAPQRGTAM